MSESWSLNPELNKADEISSLLDVSDVFLRSEKPSLVFNRSALSDNFKTKFPFLVNMIGVEQDVRWHEEGDVWSHTMMALDLAAEMMSVNNLNNEDRLVLMYSILYHDSEKSKVTRHILNIDGPGVKKVTSHGHDMLGGKLVEETLNDFVVDDEMGQRIKRKVKVLVEAHMRPTIVYERYLQGEKKDKIFKKLKKKLDGVEVSVDLLMMLVEIDKRSRGKGMALEVTQVNGLADMNEWFKNMSSR